jgi:hypothetical protein
MNILQYIAGQLFGSKAKTLFTTGIKGVIAGILAANPSASLASVTALVNTQLDALITHVLASVKVPVWAAPFVTSLLENIVDGLVASFYKQLAPAAS